MMRITTLFFINIIKKEKRLICAFKKILYLYNKIKNIKNYEL